MPRRTLWTPWILTASLASGLMASAAGAAVPTTSSMEGVLLSSGGGPAADGNYTVAISIYAAETGGAAVWSETGVTIAAKGGQFNYQLGSKTPLTAAALNLSKAWIGMQIGTDPELPRKQLGSNAFAFRAAVAEALECTGCLKATHLEAAVLQPYAKSTDLTAYAKTADLGTYAKTADLSAYAKVTDLTAYAKKTDLSSYATTASLADYVKAASLAKVAGTGSYADLTNKPTLATVAASGSYADLTNKPVMAKLGDACGTNLVMKGIKADGTYECVTAGIAPDMINEISNDLIWNQFVDGVNGTKDVQIKDGFAAGVTDTLTFPDVGLAQKLWVDLSLSNSDVSKVVVELYGPGMSAPYLLYNGGKTGQAIVAKYNDGTPLVSGDMNKDWLNKNIKGNWSITVKDTSAIVVPPGTPPYTYDGKFNWSLSIQTLSSKKIQVKGNLIVDGGLTMGAGGAIAGDVTFKDHVEFLDGCPQTASGERTLAMGGVCLAGAAGGKNWQNAVDYCHNMGAYVCSGSQSLLLRKQGVLANYTPAQYGSANWIASYSDNDGRWRDEIVGDASDDTGAGAAFSVACCFNWTPPRTSDQIVKVAANDTGVRVTHIHNTADVPFHYAAAYCASLKSDVCDKSQLVYLRTAGKISAGYFWSNDGEDTDGAVEYGTAGSGTLPNDLPLINGQAFACCAGERPTTACPSGTTNSGGVCYKKVVNSGTTWVNAAKDCAAIGSRVCSVAESSVLRRKGVLTIAGSWSGGFNDCDGNCAGTNGIGNAANNLNPNSGYGYACCL